MFSSSRAATANRVLDIIAFFLLLSVTVLWAVWGVGEVFHEGWYSPYWQIAYYFIPFVLVFGFSVLAIFFPLAGGIIILAGGLSYLITFIVRAGRSHTELEVSFFLMIAAIIITGLLFIFIYILKRKTGPVTYRWQNWRIFKRHTVFKKNIKIIIIAGICILLITGVGIPLLMRNLGRTPLKDYGEVRVEGNEITATFAGDGPGWYYSNDKPVVYKDREYSGLCWNEIALFGKEPIGFEGKRYGPDYDGSEGSIYYASRKDFDLYNMFRYIDSDGKILTDEIQDFWRLPSADEYARLFMRESKNAEGYFDYESGKAGFRVTPDKEAPVWAPEEMVIYYWTSDSVTDREAYDITYSGEIRKISKLTKQDYRGWRAIRTGRLEGETVRMAVESIAIDRNSGSPVVLLKQVEGDIYLPIWIGEPEAYSIALELIETKYPRPLTHDLVVAMLRSLSAEISSVEINGALYGVFLAAINLKLPDGSEIFIDSRPSDAIALALRVDCNILVSSAVLEVYGISFDSIEDRSQQFEKLQV